jgi:hypothetical protein
MHQDSSIHEWDFAKSSLELTFKNVKTSKNPIHCMCLSQDGLVLYTVVISGIIFKWSVLGGKHALLEKVWINAADWSDCQF